MLKFTPIQRRILRLLADGLPHSYGELRECLVDKTKEVSNIRAHLTALRKILRTRNEDIICEIYKRKRGYRQIAMIAKGRSGESTWLCREFAEIVRDRDGESCRNCGRSKTILEIHHIKSWKDYPNLRFVPSNGISLCNDCHKKAGRLNGSLGRPRGAVDDPVKRFLNSIEFGKKI